MSCSVLQGRLVLPAPLGCPDAAAGLSGANLVNHEARCWLMPHDSGAALQSHAWKPLCYVRRVVALQCADVCRRSISSRDGVSGAAASAHAALRLRITLLQFHSFGLIPGRSVVLVKAAGILKRLREPAARRFTPRGCNFLTID